jgi:trans-2,3-dihydro-3-hydroxyanthranilate isomerase
MPALAISQVDAFTATRLGGNPCAVVFEADSLDTPTMQAIAREMNLSETAFVLESSCADVRARYFTPAEEIPLAGHPTIATFHALVESGRLPFAGPAQTYTLELSVGVIDVEVHGDDGAVARVIMSQRAPEFLRQYRPEEVLPVFGLRPDDLLPGAVIQTVSTGTPQLMVPLRSPDSLHRVMMDTTAYHALRAAGDFFSPHFFILGGATDEGDTFSRHLGVPPDMVEDPFTGSATGGMGAYLWHYGLIAQPSFVAEQGHWMSRPGSAAVEVVGPPDGIRTVRVGGPAVTVMEGVLKV